MPLRTEREAWKAFWVCLLTPIVVPLSLVVSDRAQRPLRGPVFVDMGGFPGLAANARSFGVGVLVYGLSISTFLLGAARLAPGWPFRAALLVAALGALVLLIVVS